MLAATSQENEANDEVWGGTNPSFVQYMLAMAKYRFFLCREAPMKSLNKNPKSELG